MSDMRGEEVSEPDEGQMYTKSVSEKDDVIIEDKVSCFVVVATSYIRKRCLSCLEGSGT